MLWLPRVRCRAVAWLSLKAQTQYIFKGAGSEGINIAGSCDLNLRKKWRTKSAYRQVISGNNPDRISNVFR